jgi:hypothetical protein
MAINESHFIRALPLLAPLLITAGTVLLVTDGLQPTNWIGFKVIGQASRFFMLAAVMSMALGGVLESTFDQALLCNKALAVSFVLAIVACVFVGIHWCVAVPSIVRVHYKIGKGR